MKVILLQDIENVGKKFDIKEVADGFARNFLMPKGVIKPVTPEALKWLEIQKEIISKKAEDGLRKVQDMVSGIDGMELAIPVKVGDELQLFESINAQKIAEKLKEAGYEIKKNQIELKTPLKELGEFPVKIKFEHNLEAEITVLITEEK